MLRARPTVTYMPRAMHTGQLVVRWFLPFLLASCTLLAPYDEVTDQHATTLAIQTEAALASADAGQLSLEESNAFLTESLGTVRALKARASLKPRNTEEVEILKLLEDRYQALLDRGKPIRSSVATGLRLNLLDLQQVQVAKKRSAVFGSKPKPAQP